MPQSVRIVPLREDFTTDFTDFTDGKEEQETWKAENSSFLSVKSVKSVVPSLWLRRAAPGLRVFAIKDFMFRARGMETTVLALWLGVAAACGQNNAGPPAGVELPSSIRNPQSAIPNSALPSSIRNPQSAIRNSTLPAGVELRTYTGWVNSVFLNASEIPVQAVIVPAVGGRIVHFSWNGTNILLENSASLGAILGARNEDLFLGGYQCDAGAGGRDLPDHWQLTEGPQRWLSDAIFSAKVFSAPDPRLGVALEKEFVLAGDTGELGLLQRLRNVSDQTVKYYLADRTLCKGGGFVFFPLNKKSRFPAGWALAREAGGKRIYDGVRPASSGVSVLGGVLVAETGGDATRLGADSDARWIAYARGRLLFVKYYFYASWGDYPDAGNSVEVYFDRRATELDPLSPEIALAPGDSLLFPEKWVLMPLDREVTTAEEARRLVAKIPPAPFGR